MVEKYGLPLTDSHWAGLPVRLGEFGSAGAVEDLKGDADSILFWSGGSSEVVIDSSSAGGDTITRTAFSRRNGMIDLLPSGTTLHQVQWQGDASRCISVNLPRRAIEQLMGTRASGLNPEAAPRLGFFDEHLADLVRRIHEQASDGLSLGPAYVQGLSIALTAYVSKRYGASNGSESAGANALPQQKQRLLAAFIEEHLGSGLGLIDLAGVAGYSPDHFAKLFKHSFGLPPHQYIVARRVARAKALLRRADLSIAEVASECGFASQAHLSEVFKRATGGTPGAFRKG